MSMPIPIQTVKNRPIQNPLSSSYKATGNFRAPTALADYNCKRFALPASAQPSLREGSGTPKSSVGKVRILLKACDRTSSPVLV